jgi:hypothetical protein
MNAPASKPTKQATNKSSGDKSGTSPKQASPAAKK